MKRLIEYYTAGNKAEFARHLGVSPQTINTWLARNSFDIELIFAKCELLSSDWLLSGMGEMFAAKCEGAYIDEPRASMAHDSAITRPIYKNNQERVVKALQSAEGIPLIPLDAVAGFCSGNSTQVMEYECEKYVVPSFRGAEFLIQVKGSSMFPKYASGDIVACKCLPLGTFFQWNKVYVVDTEQGVLIKRVRRGPDDDHITLVSEDERYEPFVLRKQDIRSLAIVIGVIRLE